AGTNSIGRLTTSGINDEFPLPAGASVPYAITTGSDGNLWFVDEDATGTVGKVDPNTGNITIYPGNTFGCGQDINSGSDGNLWINVSLCYPKGQDLASIDPATGAITTFTGTTYPLSGVVGITNGPDGNLWTADFDGGRISTMRAISFTGISSPSNPGPGSVSAVAGFKVGDPNAQPNDFTATINWGDGTPDASSNGPVTLTGSQQYQIDAGSHNYAQAGTFTITFKLHDSITAADYIGTCKAKIGLVTNSTL